MRSVCVAVYVLNKRKERKFLCLFHNQQFDYLVSKKNRNLKLWSLLVTIPTTKFKNQNCAFSPNSVVMSSCDLENITMFSFKEPFTVVHFNGSMTCSLVFFMKYGLNVSVWCILIWVFKVLIFFHISNYMLSIR